MSTPRRNGFTLIELMIVIAVIGVLAGMAMPHFRVARENSRREGCQQNLNAIQTEAEIFHLDNKRYPTDMAEILPRFKTSKPCCPSADSSNPTPTYLFSKVGDANAIALCTIHSLVAKNSGEFATAVPLDSGLPPPVGKGSKKGKN